MALEGGEWPDSSRPRPETGLRRRAAAVGPAFAMVRLTAWRRGRCCDCASFRSALSYIGDPYGVRAYDSAA